MLPYQGKTLLEHAADTANDSEAGPVIVVLGAHAEELEKLIDQKKLHIVENKDWQEGLSSSIRCGLQTLKRVALLSDGVILMVCDQPFINPGILNDMIASQKKTGKGIIACQYDNAVGTPVLFYKKYFPELLELKGDKGAKMIIEKFAADLATVTFEKGSIDIDNEDDYRALNSGKF